MKSKIIPFVRPSDSGHKYQLKTTRMSKKYLLLFVLFVSVSCFSQTVNDYQYVIVPTKFSNFKENDKYRLNTTTKLLLEKYGFKTFMSTDNLPAEIGDNCQRLYADLDVDKDFLATKVRIVLKDCKENVVYATEYGKSREKDYAKAYNEAIRETEQSFDKLGYKYNGKSDFATETVPVTQAEVIVPKGSPEPVQASSESTADFYFAQPVATGFQIVNNEPRVIMRLYNTSQKNVFIGMRGSSNGVVITKNGQWFFEYYENAKFISEPLKLKF
jgi:hypothetical protein